MNFRLCVRVRVFLLPLLDLSALLPVKAQTLPTPWLIDSPAPWERRALTQPMIHESV